MPTGNRDIVWIASYPKSGNTWVRFMLANLLWGPRSSAADLNQLIPDLHEMPGLSTSAIPAGILKTHFVYSPALPAASRTAACLYVVRHPADVLSSNFHYSLRSIDSGDDSRAAFDRYVEEFLRNGGDPRWIQLGMGRWDENVLSWLEGRHPFPVYLLKYEELQSSPRRACQFLGQLLRPHISEPEIDAAVANSSFARMREIEEADIRDRRVGIFYKPYLHATIDSGRRFMRRGEPGDGRGALSAPQRERLERVFGSLLARLGYLQPPMRPSAA